MTVSDLLEQSCWYYKYILVDNLGQAVRTQFLDLADLLQAVRFFRV